MNSRSHICQSAAAKLRAAEISTLRVLAGFDGFVDDITEVVDKRTSPTQYHRLHTIAAFAARIAEAAGESTNFEMVVREQKLGGNGPIMAHALACIGLATTYIGNLGQPSVHPVFLPFSKNAHVISIAPPAHTQALEFMDGKLMLGDLGPLSQITWQRILDTIGLERLVHLVENADLLAMVNWTMLPHMTSIWHGLIQHVLPRLSPRPRCAFIDLADPQKRLVEDLRAAIHTLRSMHSAIHVILGLNLSEASQVASAIGPRPGAALDLPQLASHIRQELGIGTVVIHPRSGAAAANEHESAAFAGPFIKAPKISTGAGDHFNAGFALGQILRMPLAESLATGSATSGYYVRCGESPSREQLADFLEQLPEPESM